jgi:hypothetical protein
MLLLFRKDKYWFVYNNVVLEALFDNIKANIMFYDYQIDHRTIGWFTKINRYVDLNTLHKKKPTQMILIFWVG